MYKSAISAGSGEDQGPPRIRSGEETNRYFNKDVILGRDIPSRGPVFTTCPIIICSSIFLKACCKNADNLGGDY